MMPRGGVAIGSRPTIAAAGVVVALVALVVVPLAELVRVATEDGASGVRGSLRAPGAPLAIVHTVVIAGVVAVAAVTAATVCAIAVERRSGRLRTALRLLLASPLIIPEFVLGFSWSQAYGPAGVGDQAAHVAIPGLLGPFGIALVLSVHCLPLAYLAITAGLAARADPDAERAARASGARPLSVLRTVTLPLLRLPLLAAGVLVFVSAVGSFAVPQILGTPAGFATMSTLVYQDLALSAAPEAFRDLTVLALAMAAIVLVVIGAADRWLGTLNRTADRLPAGAASAPTSRSADAALVGLVSAYVALAVGVPMIALVLTALVRAPGLPPTPSEWTTANFTAAFGGPTTAAIAHTVALAVATALLVPALGTLVAMVAQGRWRASLATAVTLAFAVPGSALAVGVLIGYGRWLTGSIVVILLAYLAKFWVFGHRPVQAALDRLSPDLVRAARISGACPATAIRTVVLPLIRIALVTSAALAFLFATHELTMSTILYGPGSETFAVVILNQQDLGDTGATAALAVVLTIPAVLVAATLLALARSSSSRPRVRPVRAPLTPAVRGPVRPAVRP
jgi:iron(III) transport system permease protein